MKILQSAQTRAAGFTILAFALIGGLLYVKTLTHDFVALDDDMVIFNNPIVQDMTPRTMYQAFTTYDPELYVPLTVISLQVSWLMGGGEPWAFHLGNVVLHIANALLAAWLLSLLLRNKWIGIACGLIYLIHPLNVEAVAWASARKDVLSTVFGFASCIAYVYGARGWKPGRRVSLELFLCALLAKVSIIVLPAWFILFDWIEHKRLTRRMLIQQWPFFGLAATFAAIAIAGKPHGLAGLPLYAYLSIGAKAAMQYIEQFAIPANLSIAYELTGPMTSLRPDILWSIAGCIGLVAVAVFLRKKFPLISVGIAMYFVALAPTFFNIIKGRAIYFASDRYAYVALIGMLLALGAITAEVLRRVPRSAPALIPIFGVLLVAWTITATRAVGVWRDNIPLFEHALSISPDSAMILNNLGNAYITSGNPEKAERLYRDALLSHPHWGTLHMNIANALEKQGRTDEAIDLLRVVIDTHEADRAEAYFRLGNIFASMERKDEALAAYAASMEIDPSFVMSQFGELRRFANE